MVKTYQEHAPDPVQAMEWTGEPQVNSLGNWNPDIRVHNGRWFLKDIYSHKSTLSLGDFIIKQNGVYKVCDGRGFLENYSEVQISNS